MIEPKLLALGTAIAFGLAPVILKMAFRRGGSPGTGMIVGLVVAVPVYLATSDGHLDPGPSRVLGCPLRLSSAHLRRVVDGLLHGGAGWLLRWRPMEQVDEDGGDGRGDQEPATPPRQDEEERQGEERASHPDEGRRPDHPSEGAQARQDGRPEEDGRPDHEPGHDQWNDQADDRDRPRNSSHLRRGPPQCSRGGRGTGVPRAGAGRPLLWPIVAGGASPRSTASRSTARRGAAPPRRAPHTDAFRRANRGPGPTSPHCVR